jgi:hypothetical protein
VATSTKDCLLALQAPRTSKSETLFAFTASDDPGCFSCNCNKPLLLLPHRQVPEPRCQCWWGPHIIQTSYCKSQFEKILGWFKNRTPGLK